MVDQSPLAESASSVGLNGWPQLPPDPSSRVNRSRCSALYFIRSPWRRRAVSVHCWLRGYRVSDREVVAPFLRMMEEVIEEAGDRAEGRRLDIMGSEVGRSEADD
jgi:hypothetical protein